MSVTGHGTEICTSATRPSNPSLGAIIYQTDTDEYLKYVTDRDGTARWMQADVKTGRSIAINGAFDVWQRGTSFASGSVASPYYTVDRWQTVRGSFTAGATYSRVASDLTGFNYFLRSQRDSGNTSTANIHASTSFETINVKRLQGNRLTLSFWARAGANYSASSSLLNAQIVVGTGTDSNYLVTGFTSSSFLLSATPTLTTSWQRFSFTTSSNLLSTHNQLAINIYSTPVGTAGANDYYDIAGIQLEAGTAPSEFEFREFGDELRRCQRYYFRNTGGATYSPSGSGYALSTTQAIVLVNVPVPLRSTSGNTIESSNIRVFDGAAGPAITSLTIDWPAPTVFSLIANVASGLTIYRPVILQNNNNTAGYLAIGAEL